MQSQWGLYVYVLGALVAALFIKKSVRRQYFSEKNCSKFAAIFFSIVLLVSIFTHNRFMLPQIDLALFFIAVYVLIGVFVKNNLRWKRGLPVAILIAVCIPFSVEFGSGFGFFLRIASSQVVEVVLNAAGVHVMSSHDILIFENGIAQVDTPCSGLKSLLTGTLFFLSAVFIKKRTINLATCVQYVVFCCVLLFTNVLRIFVLVAIYEIIRWKELAEVIHIPLGILAFSVSCAVGWGMLTYFPQKKQRVEQEKDSTYNLLPVLLMVLSLGIAIGFKSPRSTHSFVMSASDSKLLTEINASPLQLTKAEEGFFSTKANTQALKWRFAASGVKGEILLVESSSLNGIHSPEICFFSNGMIIKTVSEETISNIHCTVVSFKNSEKRAVYWLQHNKNTTQSFLFRFWEHVLYGNTKWTMKALLFDAQSTLENKHVRGVLRTLYNIKNK